MIVVGGKLVYTKNTNKLCSKFPMGNRSTRLLMKTLPGKDI
jgi:hypothetical protein